MTIATRNISHVTVAASILYNFVDSSTQKKAIVFSFEIWFKSFEMDFFVS